jgi:hypothetical protein
MYEKLIKVNTDSKIIGSFIYSLENIKLQVTNTVFKINATKQYLIDLFLVSKAWFARILIMETIISPSDSVINNPPYPNNHLTRNQTNLSGKKNSPLIKRLL